MAFIVHPAIEPIILVEILIFIFMNSLWISIYFKYRKKRLTEKTKIQLPVSIIIPSYNKGSVLKQTIDSVLSLDYQNKEIIVVNDGSTDSTIKICKPYIEQKKILLINQKHKGKSYALNAGINAAKNDIIVTVDADSMPKNDSIKRLVSHFADEKIGAVAGTLKVIYAKKILTLFQAIEYLCMNFQRMCQGFLSAILICPGPLTAYRKDAIIKAGYFTDDTLVEDFDMTIKLHKVGYKVVHEKKAEVFTIPPNNLKELWKQRVRWGRGGIQIVKKHFDIFFNKKVRMLGMFSFPLHILWILLPILLFSTIILYTIPNFVLSFYNTILNLNLTPTIITNIILLYAAIEELIIDILGFKELNFILASGYISVIIYLCLTFISFKSLKEKIKLSDFKSLLFITFYWFLLLFVFMHALILELTSRKKRW